MSIFVFFYLFLLFLIFFLLSFPFLFGRSFHVLKARSEMLTTENFWKFDIAAGGFIGYCVMLPTRLMMITRKYY